MASLQLHIGPPKVPIYALAQSAVGRHVSAIGGPCNPAKLIADSLYVLAQKMAQVRELTCALPLPPVPTQLLFPAALRKLDFLASDLGPLANVTAALRSISRLPLLENLAINFQPVDPQISFAPLAELPLLRSLHIRGFSKFSDAQVDQLRALPQLQKVDIPVTTQLLRRLLRQPHQLQWQQLSLPNRLDDETAALLPQLPSLTKIFCRTSCARFEWLSGLPNLTEAHLWLGPAGAEGHAASLVAGLRHCPSIEILGLGYYSDLTEAQLADLLPRLPRLRELVLRSLDIDSLCFLAQAPMTEQLDSLQLWDCARLLLTELRHVHALRGLQSLHLEDSFDELMDSHCQSFYRPPSLVLPRLQSFFYLPPDSEIFVDNAFDDDDNEDDDNDEDAEDDEGDGDE